MDKYTKALDILKKSIGEGSRGGHVIGHTRSGQPIYDSAHHESHQQFKAQDHKDAMNHHYEIWSKTQEKINALRQQNPNWNPPKEIHDFLKHHYTHMQMHQNVMSRKMDKETAQKKVLENKGDQPIKGPKPYNTPQNIHKSEEITPFYSAVIVVDSKQKNFLLGKRKEDGLWTSPAGGAKMGELPKKTAIREAFEEAGLVLEESQLQELPMGYADNYKPVHCYVAILTPEQMKNISTINDPDEEVKEWKWISIDEKMPNTDENRAATLLNAKMHLAGIVMKSYHNLDDMEGMTSINTHEFKEENEESHPIKSSIEKLMEGYEAGDEPRRLMLDEEHTLHLVRVDEGIFSGFVKKKSEEGLEETAVSLDKMPIPSIVQYLKAKEIIKDAPKQVELKQDDSALREVIERLAGMTVYGDVNITIKKAKALPIGTIRQWGVYKYVKHADGWVVVGGEHHGKLMGNFKSEPSHGDFARHYEGSTPKQDEPETKPETPKMDEGSGSKKDNKTKAKPKTESPKEESKPKSPEEEKAHAKEMGKKAHAAGKKATPSQDSELMNLLKERKGEVGSSIHILDGWSEGWHEANRAADVPEPKTEEPKKADEEIDEQPETDAKFGQVDNPREEAEAEQAELESQGEYANARKSKISNLGEDVEGSARHKAMDWKGLAQAEKDGNAEAFIKRDQLLKIEPTKFDEMVTPENYMVALQMQSALERFPPAPKHSWLTGGWDTKSDDELRYAEVKTPAGSTRKIHPSEFERLEREGNLPGEVVKKVTVGDIKKQIRSDYLEAFNKVKAAATEIVKTKGTADLQTNMKTLQSEVQKIIKERREKDRYDEMSNNMINYLNKTISPSLRKQKNTTMNDLNEFLEMAAKYHQTDSAGLLNNKEVAEQAKQVIQGKAAHKIFGVEKEGKKRFTAADLYVDHAERQGPDSGLNSVKEQADFLSNKAKMRAVQWGNSVTDDEREHHLKHAANAFKDLTDILGLPEEMGSFNGRLALAIGARGKGSALAHYEPDTKTINLTRKSGVGSLAHEWGHMLDNVLAEVHTGSGRNYVSEGSSFGKKDIPVYKEMQEFQYSDTMSQFRDKLRDAIREEQKKGNYVDSDYWTSRKEVWARCFEKYVSHKLEKSGRKNTYLSGVKDHAFWPNDKEIEAMAPYFDKIIEAAKSNGDIKKALEILGITL